MKMRILGVLFIVLVAQAHIAQGALTFGTVTSGLTNIVSGVINAGVNIVTTSTNAIINATTSTINAIGGAANTTTNLLTNTTSNVISTIANTTNAVVSTVANATTDVATSVISAGQILLNNTVNSITNVIDDLISDVRNSNVSSGISDATGDAINLVLTTIADGVTGLGNVSEALADNVIDVVTAIPDAFYGFVNGIQNTTTVDIPKLNLLDNIQEILNTSGSDITAQIISAVESGVDDLSSVIIPLEGSSLEAIDNILAIVGDAPEILKNIAAILEKTLSASAAAIANDITKIVSLLSGLATTCGNSLADATQTLIKSATTNAASCVLSEIAIINDHLTQISNLQTILKAEKAAGAISGSTVASVLTLSASIGVNTEISMYRLPLCGGVQAINTAGSIPALISTIFSCLG